jgi:hypothetical protein
LELQHLWLELKNLLRVHAPAMFPAEELENLASEEMEGHEDVGYNTRPSNKNKQIVFDDDEENEFNGGDPDAYFLAQVLE